MCGLVFPSRTSEREGKGCCVLERRVARRRGACEGAFEPITHCCVVFITAVPNTKLCAWGEEDSGGHVL
jgi:hypothetical protein